MASLDLVKMVNTVDLLLKPVQKILSLMLPDYIERALKSEEGREFVVEEADRRLVEAYPQTAIMPESTRKKIIRRVLDMMLDDILLDDSE